MSVCVDLVSVCDRVEIFYSTVPGPVPYSRSVCLSDYNVCTNPRKRFYTTVGIPNNLLGFRGPRMHKPQCRIRDPRRHYLFTVVTNGSQATLLADSIFSPKGSWRPFRRALKRGSSISSSGPSMGMPRALRYTLGQRFIHAHAPCTRAAPLDSYLTGSLHTMTEIARLSSHSGLS